MSGARAKKKRRRRARAGGAGAGGGAGGARPAEPRPPRERAAAAAPAESRLPRERAAAPAAARPSRFEVRDGVARPQPPWAPFPLTEIGMAVGLAIFVAGVLSHGRRGMWLLAVGVVVLAVVVVELCLREHFAGYRSHTLLLAVLPVAVLDGVMVRAFGDVLRGPLVLVAALGLAAALGWWLRTRFAAAHERATATPQV
ncbi:MAG: hypothetical protein QOJ89_2899 [bacterium]